MPEKKKSSINVKPVARAPIARSTPIVRSAVPSKPLTTTTTTKPPAASGTIGPVPTPAAAPRTVPDLAATKPVVAAPIHGRASSIVAPKPTPATQLPLVDMTSPVERPSSPVPRAVPAAARAGSARNSIEGSTVRSLPSDALRSPPPPSSTASVAPTPSVLPPRPPSNPPLVPPAPPQVVASPIPPVRTQSAAAVPTSTIPPSTVTTGTGELSKEDKAAKMAAAREERRLRMLKAKEARK